MLSNERHRQHQSLLQAPKIPNMFKKSTSGTLSPETTTTTSSGYSTGGSSVSNTQDPCMKKSSSIAHKQYSHQEQHKTKSKGLHNLLTKLKSLLLPTRTKQQIHSRTMRSTTSRQISSANILRQYHQYTTIYDVLPSSITTSNTISLPFTYYNDSPIRQSKGNFEKISAWLNDTEKMIKNKQHKNDILFIDPSQQKTTLSSMIKNDDQVKKNT
ncbi:unnamed protein product [Rotaria sp. Silwood2]|nr:unnamed protein product [Rotaria sp. Silwood2]CAF2498952.1 unnamed protein product [Rotaria sp. Silwood2]CAF2729100.1 unnamed protein product [Rotaria sp. Silwood2]CAF2963231.1 unnamed protein product [Rotaria sp. Silwood2]CAF3922542.1 unnamed protein product [Rotaria sp. Silwood2]